MSKYYDTAKSSSNSSRTSRLMMVGLGMLIGAAGMYFAQSFLRPSRTAFPRPVAVQTAPSRPVSSGNDNKADTISNAEAQKQLEAARNLFSTDEKLAALLNIAEQSSTDEIPALLNKAATDPALSGARMDFLKKLLSRWAGSDPSAALAWTRSFGTTTERTTLATAVLQEWAMRDPRAAINQASQETCFSRSELLQATLAPWGHTDPQAALQWIAALPASPMQANLRYSFLSNLVATDPVTAADYAAANCPGDSLNQVVSLWATKDPLVAVAWALSLPGGKVRTDSLHSLADAWVQVDLAGASQYASTLKEPDQRSSFVGAVAQKWAETDPKAALNWSQSLADPSDREHAAYVAITRWAESSPTQAAQYLSTLGDNAVSGSTVPLVASRWAEQNPSEAASWAMSLPDDELRVNAVSSIAGEWANADPQALRSWLSGLPAGRSKDAAIASSASRLVTTQPAAAVELSSQISDPEMRSDNLTSTIAEWKNIDANAAKSWLNKANLDPALKAKLTTELQ